MNGSIVMSVDSDLSLKALLPSMFMKPEYLSDVIYWQGHIPFAFWCIDALKPKVLVELGTHKGDSYLAFCQAVKDMSLDTKCYAIDSWEGDEHIGQYKNSVYSDLLSYHDERYGDFSVLIRSYFDEAVSRFEDHSIDLLHIDGLHTYDAVKSDFEAYKNKLSNRSIVLFHDISVRQDGFGVYQFWEEICTKYPHFQFNHSNGLGVLVVGEEAPDLFMDLVKAPDCDTALFTAVFSGLGELVCMQRKNFELEKFMKRDLDDFSELNTALVEENRTLVKQREELRIQRDNLAQKLDTGVIGFINRFLENNQKK